MPVALTTTPSADLYKQYQAALDKAQSYRETNQNNLARDYNATANALLEQYNLRLRFEQQYGSNASDALSNLYDNRANSERNAELQRRAAVQAQEQATIQANYNIAPGGMSSGGKFLNPAQNLLPGGYSSGGQAYSPTPIEPKQTTTVTTVPAQHLYSSEEGYYSFSPQISAGKDYYGRTGAENQGTTNTLSYSTEPLKVFTKPTLYRDVDYIDEHGVPVYGAVKYASATEFRAATPAEASYFQGKEAEQKFNVEKGISYAPLKSTRLINKIDSTLNNELIDTTQRANTYGRDFTNRIADDVGFTQEVRHNLANRDAEVLTPELDFDVAKVAASMSFKGTASQDNLNVKNGIGYNFIPKPIRQASDFVAGVEQNVGNTALRAIQYGADFEKNLAAGYRPYVANEIYNVISLPIDRPVESLASLGTGFVLGAAFESAPYLAADFFETGGYKLTAKGIEYLAPKANTILGAGFIGYQTLSTAKQLSNPDLTGLQREDIISNALIDNLLFFKGAKAGGKVAGDLFPSQPVRVATGSYEVIVQPGEIEGRISPKQPSIFYFESLEKATKFAQSFETGSDKVMINPGSKVVSVSPIKDMFGSFFDYVPTYDYLGDVRGSDIIRTDAYGKEMKVTQTAAEAKVGYNKVLNQLMNSDIPEYKARGILAQKYPKAIQVELLADARIIVGKDGEKLAIEGDQFNTYLKKDFMGEQELEASRAKVSQTSAVRRPEHYKLFFEGVREDANGNIEYLGEKRAFKVPDFDNLVSVYHGTDTKTAKIIEDQGLLPAARTGINRGIHVGSDQVYTSLNKDFAQSFGDRATGRQILLGGDKDLKTEIKEFYLPKSKVKKAIKEQGGDNALNRVGEVRFDKLSAKYLKENVLEPKVMRSNERYVIEKNLVVRISPDDESAIFKQLEVVTQQSYSQPITASGKRTPVLFVDEAKNIIKTEGPPKRVVMLKEFPKTFEFDVKSNDVLRVVRLEENGFATAELSAFELKPEKAATAQSLPFSGEFAESYDLIGKENVNAKKMQIAEINVINRDFLKPKTVYVTDKFGRTEAFDISDFGTEPAKKGKPFDVEYWSRKIAEDTNPKPSIEVRPPKTGSKGVSNTLGFQDELLQLNEQFGDSHYIPTIEPYSKAVSIERSMVFDRASVSTRSAPIFLAPSRPQTRVFTESKSASYLEPKTDFDIKSYTETKVDTKTYLEPKIDIKSDIKIDLEPKIEIRQEPRADIKIDIKLEPKIEPKLEPRLEPRLELFPSLKTYLEPKIDITGKPSDFNFGTRKKKGRRVVQAYSVLLKKRGKYVPIATGLARGRALQFGSDKALTDLARSFKITKSGTTEIDDFSDFGVNPKQFRNYKVRKGKTVSLVDEFIQKSSANLQTREEKNLIQQAKRSKKGGFFY